MPTGFYYNETSRLICFVLFQFRQRQNSLCEKCPNTEFFLVRIFPYSDRIGENKDQKILRIQTLHTVVIYRKFQGYFSLPQHNHKECKDAFSFLVVFILIRDGYKKVLVPYCRGRPVRLIITIKLCLIKSVICVFREAYCICWRRVDKICQSNVDASLAYCHFFMFEFPLLSPFQAIQALHSQTVTTNKK